MENAWSVSRPFTFAAGSGVEMWDKLRRLASDLIDGVAIHATAGGGEPPAVAIDVHRRPLVPRDYAIAAAVAGLVLGVLIGRR